MGRRRGGRRATVAALAHHQIQPGVPRLQGDAQIGGDVRAGGDTQLEAAADLSQDAPSLLLGEAVAAAGAGAAAEREVGEPGLAGWEVSGPALGTEGVRLAEVAGRSVDC